MRADHPDADTKTPGALMSADDAHKTCRLGVRYAPHHLRNQRQILLAPSNDSHVWHCAVVTTTAMVASPVTPSVHSVGHTKGESLCWWK